MGFILKVIPLELFLGMASLDMQLLPRCAGIFLKDKNSCEAAWAVHVSEMCVTGLDSWRPTWVM